MAGVAGLSGPQAWVVYRDARSHLLAATQQRLNRVLLLELHAASLAGELGRGNEKERWSAFVDRAATPEFAAALTERYPTLLARIDAAGRNLIEAVGTLAERFVADLPDLDAQPLGELRALRLGAGDPHRGGHTVSRLEFAGGAVMYKPRPIEVDAALDAVLATLLPVPERDRIRTARIFVRDGYGWSAFVEHRYCADDTETERFYANLGRWLAVMRLIGGTDLHADNIVAHGPVPVVVDAETMLASNDVADRPGNSSPPSHPAYADGGASAADVASRILRRAVLRTGILPVRVDLLSGIDVSAAGRLTSEQPTLTAPTIADAGTDSARLVNGEARIAEVRNHPNPDPEPERFWEHIVSGFLELSTRLCALDAAGELEAALSPFLGCEVRRVVRSTQVYGDIRRMLWHPAALHDEAAAVEHARAALLRHAQANPVAPSDTATIDGEIAELLVGDTPVFTAHVDKRQLASALDDWRAADLELEARLIRFSLAGVYRDGLPRPKTATIKSEPIDTSHVICPAELDKRRRALAADAVRTMRDTAIRGDNRGEGDKGDTVTWIGPVFGEKGWAVRALESDLHSGQAGVALCLAAYVHEVAAGRADHVDGVSELLPGTLAALRAAENRRRSHRIGALVGLGGQVWTWTALYRLLGDRGLLDRAVSRAVPLSKGLHASNARWSADWSAGLAGSITPLLGLADATGDGRWLDLAATSGDLLSQHVDSGRLPDEIGFAHGRAGIGWALHRIAASAAGDAQRRDRWRALATEVFDPATVTTQDADDPAPADGRTAFPRDANDRAADDPGWCQGLAGIGLAACDLVTLAADTDDADDAADTDDSGGPYMAVRRHVARKLASPPPAESRSLCHGAAGRWEFLAAAARVLPSGSAAPSRQQIDAWLIVQLEQQAKTAAQLAEATAPGMLNGLAGTVLTLLRMHPGHELPSPLLLGT